MEELQTDVGAVTPDPAILGADSSTAPESSSAESTAGDVITEDAKAPETEVDPLADVPSLEELQKLAEQKVPNAAALANLRTAYEGVKPYKELAPWKEVADLVGDPAQARAAYEMIGMLRTPVEGNPNEFTTRPFIERIDQERPGSANQLLNDLLMYEVPDDKGYKDTLVRHMYRTHGLDPDRIDDYRNIDTLRASGVVSAEDLSRIPEQYRDAFRASSKSFQDDVLELLRARETDPEYGLRAEEHLRNAQASMEWREKEQRDQQAAMRKAEQDQAELREKVVQAIEQDVTSEVTSIHDSILQNLSSQFTFSSDATQDSLAKGQILSVLANLQHPYPVYRNMAVEQLKAVGVDIKDWDALTVRWEQERSKYIAFKEAGQENTWDAREAKQKSDFAKQQILARANDYAFKLAQVSGERAAGLAAQKGSQLETASARFVPSGNGNVQRSDNPYMNNPYEPGTQEWSKWYRDLDKANNLTGASMFGS